MGVRRNREMLAVISPLNDEEVHAQQNRVSLGKNEKEPQSL